METLQMSSLLADTVNLLIERLRAEKNTINSIDGKKPEEEDMAADYGGGGGGNGHGAITLDPVSIISLLALGAFLINNILQLLRANMGAAAMPTMPREGGRLMRSQSDVLPFIMPSTLTKNGLPFPGDEPSFIDFFENVGSLYYLQPKKRNMCMKRVVCNYINLKEGRENNPAPLKNKIFDFMLSTVTKLVAPEISDNDKEEKCTRAQKFCSDALLKDARVSIEYKIYSQVSSWITKLAFNGLASG
ncbi:hypothetical protein Ocin01_07403 [Orchesella cincta]|uniref:Uncharacterized protein n=1 Tax=Orchesella cincta TaxID=48709 RepID=A0A1D2N1V9_ORCCI|nr:hypothetical protein Ocin01_07403 [Orchesella cincta]